MLLEELKRGTKEERTQTLEQGEYRMQTWLRTLAIIWSVHGNTICDMSSHGMPLPITNPNNECLVEKKKEVCIQAHVILTLQHLLPLNHLTWNKIRPHWANYFGCPCHSDSHTFRGCFCPMKWALQRLRGEGVHSHHGHCPWISLSLENSRRCGRKNQW